LTSHIVANRLLVKISKLVYASSVNLAIKPCSAPKEGNQ